MIITMQYFFILFPESNYINNARLISTVAPFYYPFIHWRAGAKEKTTPLYMPMSKYIQSQTQTRQEWLHMIRSDPYFH